MSLKKSLVIATVGALALAIPIARLYVGIPFVPPSGREVVARLSGLPIPMFARSLDAVSECSGSFCMDYYGRGLIQLSPAPCGKAIAEAKMRGWLSLPIPGDLNVIQETGAPSTPSEGYFRFEQRRPDEHMFAWIDTATCRVYAELDIT
jgi:hypothetical protein